MNSLIILSKALFKSSLRFVIFILPALVISVILATTWYFTHPYLSVLEHKTADLINAGFWLVYVLLATFAMGNAIEKIQKMQGAINKAGEAEGNPDSAKESKRQEEQFFSLMKTPIQPVLLHYVGFAAFCLFFNYFTTHYEKPLDGVISIFEVSALLVIFYTTLLEVIDVFGGYWQLDTTRMPPSWEDRIIKELGSKKILGSLMIYHFVANGHSHKTIKTTKTTIKEEITVNKKVEEITEDETD